MKTLRSIITVVALSLAVITSAHAQDKNAVIRIKTSATCDMCKTTIEHYLAFEKGIKRSELDVSTKIVTVTYNPRKTTPDAIRIAVTKSGYDADTLKADPKAFARLEECCRKGQVCTDLPGK